MEKGAMNARCANSTNLKDEVSCSKDRFAVNQTLVFHPDNFRDEFCGKSPALRLAAKCYNKLKAELNRS